jgi:hypothetical protein
MKEILNKIYPPVRQDVRWHRIMKVIGWALSVASVTFFPITFAIYFGLIQRAILYIAYGDNKEKWLKQQSNN